MSVLFVRYFSCGMGPVEVARLRPLPFPKLPEPKWNLAAALGVISLEEATFTGRQVLPATVVVLEEIHEIPLEGSGCFGTQYA